MIDNNRLPRFLTRDQVALILHAPSTRERLLFELTYKHGLRICEAVALDTTDIFLRDHRILVRRSKHGVTMFQPLFQSTLDLLEWDRWAAALEAPGPLFISRQGRLSKAQAQMLFKTAARRVGVLLPRGVGVHSLRHSIAVHLLDAGASLEFVQDHLGHRDIATTAIYARVSDVKRRIEQQRVEASGLIAGFFSAVDDSVFPQWKSSAQPGDTFLLSTAIHNPFPKKVTS